jgi:hypothetical protein
MQQPGFSNVWNFPATPIQSNRQNLAHQIAGLTSDQEAQALAKRYNKVIQKVSWEDAARNKNSCWGPNISDFTLCATLPNGDQRSKAESVAMPVIRSPNFSDVTVDVDYRKFPIVVGNHNGTDLKTITLKDYLEGIDQYLDVAITDDDDSLWRDRDEKILTSTQACFLPLHEGRVAFNGRIFNYQYDEDDPAVLVILASASGTSAQTITKRQQELYFNKNGKAADFLAERLEVFRAEQAKLTGKEKQEGAMTDEEKSKNVIFMFQVPLKQTRVRNPVLEMCGSFGMASPQCGLMSMSFPMAQSASLGMDHAIISTTEGHGKFEGAKNKKLIRDDRFPIRCTVQYYYVTDTAKISEQEMATIAFQLDKVYDAAPIANKGSLVVDPIPEKPRVTAWNQQAGPQYGNFNVGAF